MVAIVHDVSQRARLERERAAAEDKLRQSQKMEAINEAWDREFLKRWADNDREALTSYSDAEIYKNAGQGGFEIRTFIAAAAAAKGARGEIQFCEPVPVFAVSCTIARMNLAA